MAPDRVGSSNMWNLLEGEFFIDRVTGEKVNGPLTVRVNETGRGLLAVQGTNQKYEILGDNLEDFPLVVKKVNS